MSANREYQVWLLSLIDKGYTIQRPDGISESRWKAMIRFYETKGEPTQDSNVEKLIREDYYGN